MATTSASTRPTEMNTRRVWLLALAAGLFAAWIGYLAYLAITTTAHPTYVLSRPQFLVADYWIVAEVKDLEQPIKIADVVYVRPAAKDKQPQKGEEVKLSNLSECREYWIGSGNYILPLMRTEKGYRVAPVPHGPPALTPRIYPDNEETRAQLNQLPKE